MAVFFDHNATTPLCAAAREAWLAASDGRWRNPSSLYRAAAAANVALEDARAALAERLECEPGEILFNSGATEGNHSLLAWAGEHWPTGKVAISGVEHPSVREPARRFFRGDRFVEIPVDSEGRVRLDALAEILDGGEFALVSVLAACNETGVLQPWEQIGALCRERGIPFHCDATQWIGKLPLAGLAAACDYVTGSAHKFGGPKGCGFLKMASEDDDYRGQTGGPQESRRRAGTQDVAAVEAMMAALDWVEKERIAGAGSVAADRDRFEGAVRAAIPGTRIMAGDAPRLWNTTMLAMPDFEHVRWLTRLDRLGFEVSTGSACSSGSEGPSHTLQAMGADFAIMKRVLRVSAGWDTRTEDWDGLSDAFAKAFEELSAPAGRRAGRGILADPGRL